MPSLPELEVYKDWIESEFSGRRIIQAQPLDFRVVRASSETLSQVADGQPLMSTDRYGKWLYLDTGQPKQLILHLGLTGKLTALKPDEKDPRYASFALDFGNIRLVLSDYRHLAKVYVENFESFKAEKALGPDFFSLSEDEFVQALTGRNRGIRDLLMDQRVMAGIGGKYSDEMLWQAKIHPSQKAGQLRPGQITQLFQLAKEITEVAISLGADVARFSAEWLIPHRHSDLICPRCHGALANYAHSGTAIIYCPHCQPAD